MRLGIDLGGTKIEGAVLDPTGAIVARERIPTERERGYGHIVERVALLVEKLAPLAPGIREVGIGTPGSVSRRDGTLKNSNTTCLNGRPLHADLESRLGLRVRLENDANCFALAEALAGSGRGHDVVFGVILGTGVGGGIVLHGSLWPGPQHVAGEWGHHALDPEGPPCYCGQRGCVETFLSGPALESAYRDALALTFAPRGADDAAGGAGAGNDTPSAIAIAARAAAGDPVARRVLDDYLARFGRALANVIAILDPSVIVLGGGLSNLDELYDRGRDAVARCVFNDELTTPIVKHTLGDSAGVVGAALLAAEHG